LETVRAALEECARTAPEILGGLVDEDWALRYGRQVRLVRQPSHPATWLKQAGADAADLLGRVRSHCPGHGTGTRDGGVTLRAQNARALGTRRGVLRCRFLEEYALANRVQHPRNVSLRETWILPPLDDWLGKVFLPHRLDDTIDLMAGDAPPVGDENRAAAAAQTVIADCDAKLTTHRAALEAGADPALVTQWITETQARKARAEAELRTTAKGPGARMTRDKIARLVRSISDLAAVVRQQEPRTRRRSVAS
jgi:hypothetical protein